MSLIDRRARQGRRNPVPALTEAQDAALNDLVAHHALTERQAFLVHEALARTDRPVGARRWFAEVAGYLGGVLVLGGGALLLGTSWDKLTDMSRSTMLIGITVFLALAGLVTAGGPAALADLPGSGNPVRRRVTSALFALGSGTAAGAAAVLANEQPWVAAGIVGLLVAAVGYAIAPASFGVLAIDTFAVILGISLMAEYGDATAMQVSGSMIVTGVGLAALTEVGLLVPRDLSLGTASAIALVGGQLPLMLDGPAGWGYGLTFAVGMACFALYWLRESAALLVMGVIAVALAVPEAVWDVTNGAIGGAAVLLVAGATLLVVSAIGLHVWRQRPPGDPL